MASNFKINFLMVSVAVFLLLIASASARFSIKISESEIQTICSKAKNPEFCQTFLKSKPETVQADLPALAKLTVDSARKSASMTLAEIESLLQQASDPKSKEVYTSCSENYDSATTNLGDALKALVGGDPGTVNIKVSAAMTDADTCKRDLVGVSPDPSSVVKGIENLENVSSIALVISNMLPK
ncbi:PREDICTED: pectinesterase inhibitor 1-like [Tarenaya hassleriana]|uniref:pectinesterase inhibitor 1-like n=1 Tax=Tarenaya hassleriana TaxID=28532 RepID=UPI00053CA81E|nr:PREDICTED: pectinesterase inhibitor 1-like [Tarenaya hassleriana]